MIDNWVTFIIPTLGRYSLHKALNSLKDQTNGNWKAIVVFDNHDVTISTDDKISAYRFDKPPNVGAGIVRNYALPLVDTEWMAFLDDDDYLHKTYVDRIISWGNQYDLISFTYKDVTNGNIQPPPNLKKFVACNFGISIAVRTKIVQDNNIQFVPTAIEDYSFIMDCINAGARSVITHELLYFVNGRGKWIQ